MMHKLYFLSFLFIALTSCTTEPLEGLPTTSVAVSTGTTFDLRATNSTVQQGNLYPWITAMQITSSHEASGLINTNHYAIVPNGTAGAETKFIIDNVIIGKNVFTASSKTNVQERLETSQVAKSVPVSKAIGDLNNRNPYAIYSSTAPVTYTIIQDHQQNIKIPLKTNNSRLIALFSTSNNHRTTITCYVDGSVFGPSASTTRDLNATFYWSDRHSLAGKSVYFKIVIDKPSEKPVIFNTTPILLKASNTSKIMYQIIDNTLISTPM